MFEKSWVLSQHLSKNLQSRRRKETLEIADILVLQRPNIVFYEKSHLDDIFMYLNEEAIARGWQA